MHFYCSNSSREKQENAENEIIRYNQMSSFFHNLNNAKKEHKLFSLWCLLLIFNTIWKIGIPRPLLLRSTRIWPMRASDITKVTNESFKNKFNRERESRGLGIPFLDISNIGIPRPRGLYFLVRPEIGQWEHRISQRWPIRASKISSIANANVEA